MTTGDTRDWYYRLGLSRRVSEWFCLPDVTFSELIRELKKLGDQDTVRTLQVSGVEFQGLRTAVLPMGWSWAVFLAHNALRELVAGATDPASRTIFEPHRNLIEGAPPPLLSAGDPRFHSEYIDDYCLIIPTWTEGLSKVRALAHCVRAALVAKGFLVHKEECGFKVRTLGHDLGGKTPRCEAAPEKIWLAIEARWELAVRGRGVPSVVECTLALTSWLFMTKRPALSIFEETYTWVREQREERHRRELPRMVRRELAAASLILPLVGQNLDIIWHPTAMMFDVSGWAMEWWALRPPRTSSGGRAAGPSEKAGPQPLGTWRPSTSCGSRRPRRPTTASTWSSLRESRSQSTSSGTCSAATVASTTSSGTYFVSVDFKVFASSSRTSTSATARSATFRRHRRPGGASEPPGVRWDAHRPPMLYVVESALPTRRPAAASRQGSSLGAPRAPRQGAQPRRRALGPHAEPLRGVRRGGRVGGRIASRTPRRPRAASVPLDLRESMLS